MVGRGEEREWGGLGHGQPVREQERRFHEVSFSEGVLMTSGIRVWPCMETGLDRTLCLV